MSTARPAPLPALLLDGLLRDATLLRPDPPGLADTLRAHLAALDAPAGTLIGPLLVASSSAEELRTTADPDQVLTIALVADDGLLGLQEARHAIQDDTWLALSHVEIALPTGFAPDEATRALLDELAFTVPTFVEVPRTGFERALDVLSDDGVEHAAYRVGAELDADVPTDGELAAFVHACTSRGVGFALTGGPDDAVRTTSPTGGPRHGVLNVLAAVAAACDGASTTDLAELLATAQLDPLHEALTTAPARTVRDAVHGMGCADPRATRADLQAYGIVEPDEH